MYPRLNLCSRASPNTAPCPLAHRCVYELAMFTRGMHLPGAAHGKLLLLSLDWPSTLSPLKAKGLSRKEEARFRDFSCLKAQCYMPADRAFLLERIRDEWGSEQAFDNFVHKELPTIFAESKRRFQKQLARVGAESFELLFGE